MTLQEANEKLKGTPYFALQGKRSIAFYKRYDFLSKTDNSGYRVPKSQVAQYL